MTRRGDVDAIAKRPAWMQQAACADSAELPWIEEHKDTRGYPRRVMAGICAQCPVLTECDQYASTSTVQAGFWAGRARTAQDNGRGRWPDELITATPVEGSEESPALARRRLGPPVSQPAPVPVVAPATNADSFAPGPRRPHEPTTGSSRPGPAPGSPTPITRPLRGSRLRVGGDRMDRDRALGRLSAVVHAALQQYEHSLRLRPSGVPGRPGSPARLQLYVAAEDLYQAARRLTDEPTQARTGANG